MSAKLKGISDNVIVMGAAAPTNDQERGWSRVYWSGNAGLCVNIGHSLLLFAKSWHYEVCRKQKELRVL